MSVGVVKLGDFGLGQHLHWYQNHSKGFVGTPYYMSPQMLKGNDYSYKVGYGQAALLCRERLNQAVFLWEKGQPGCVFGVKTTQSGCVLG